MGPETPPQSEDDPLVGPDIEETKVEEEKKAEEEGEEKAEEEGEEKAENPEEL